MMGTYILKIDAPWAEKLMKTRVSFLVTPTVCINLGYITTPQDLDQYVLSSEDGSFYCGICNQAMKKKDNLKRHIESKHFPNIFSYQCPECSVVVGSRAALSNHCEVKTINK